MQIDQGTLSSEPSTTQNLSNIDPQLKHYKCNCQGNREHVIKHDYLLHFSPIYPGHCTLHHTLSTNPPTTPTNPHTSDVN